MDRIDEIRKRYNIGKVISDIPDDSDDGGMSKWYQHDIGILLAEVERLQAENEALRRERDAAIHDINEMLCVGSVTDVCRFCVRDGDCSRDEPCKSQVSWRGIAPESEGN